MSAAPRDWLPAEVAERNAVRAPVEAVVTEWAAHWIAKGRTRLCSWSLAAKGAGPEPDWRDCGAGFASGASSRALNRLAGLALDARLDPSELTPRDRSLTRALAQHMVDDLVARLRRMLGPDVAPANAPRRHVIATISDHADVLLSLAIPFDALLPLCRRSLPKASRPAKPLQPRREALGGTSLRLQATLGAAVVSLGEVRDLAVGDILVLDRALSDPVDISVPGCGAALAQGLVSEADGRVAIILQPGL